MTKEQVRIFMQVLDRHIKQLEHWSFFPKDATGQEFKSMQVSLEALHAALAEDYGAP